VTPWTATVARRARAAQGGFSLLEVVIAGSLLAVALLGHTASLFSEQKLSSSQRARSSALLASDQFMERVRSDDDWPGLYDRLRTLALAAAKEGGDVHFEDGRQAYPPTKYYDDFVLPPGITGLRVLVDVPAVPETGTEDDPPQLVLREDAALAEYSLPADLNGDGLIDDAAHDGDYRVLPMVLIMRWETHGSPAEELRVSTWLWGQR
jgi:type II secretory pathway pseudopilin PulG